VAEGLVESKPQSYTRVTRLDLRDIRDAVVVVRAMHELAVRVAVPILQPRDLLAMREANARFAAAVRQGDVEAALAADDALHDVLVTVCANRAVAETIERETPRIRRLERQKFATLSSQRSVQLHEQLIGACAAGDVDAAVAVTAAIWSALLDVLVHESDLSGAEDDLPRPRRRRGKPPRGAAQTPRAADRSPDPSAKSARPADPACTPELARPADSARTPEPVRTAEPPRPADSTPPPA
jgi:DNA-binding GntR family transcriptional regulator